MKISHWLFVQVLSLSFVTTSLEQVPFQFNFRHIGPQQGLSEATNAFISRDSRGYTWFSSLDGVNKFDGNSVKVFKSDDSNSKSVKGEIGQSPFFEDQNGNLWFCTYTALNCYIRNKNHFRSWQVSAKGNVDYGLVHLSRKGNLHFVANNQLFECAIEDLFQKSPAFRFTPKVVSQKFILDKQFLVDTNAKGELKGFYSFRNFDGGLHYWKRNSNQLFSIQSLLKKSPNLKVRQVLRDKDRHQKLWLISKQGLFSYDIENKHLTPIISAKSISHRLDFNCGIWLNKDYVLLSHSNGIILFHTKSQKFIELPGSSNLEGKAVQELYLDPSNILWVSIYGEGVYYSSLNKKPFQYLPTDSEVIGISKTPLGGVLVALSSNKTQQYNNGWQTTVLLPSIKSLHTWPEQGTIALASHSLYFQPERKSSWEPITQSSSYLNLSINCSGNRVWLCTNEGLKSLHFLDNDYQLHRFDSTGIFMSNEIHDLFFDPELQKIYLCFNNEQIRVFTKGKNKWRKEAFIPINAVFNHHSYVPQLNEYWIATTNGILCIHRISNKSYWLHEQHPELKRNVKSLITDTLGNVWIIGNFKIFRYNVKHQNIKKFSTEDGLTAGQFSQAATARSSTGKIWVGGQNGLIFFNPATFVENQNLAQIALQEFKINDTPLPDRSPNEIKKLTLPWHQNNLFFHLVAIEYTAPKSNQLEYQLKGWEKSSNLTGPVAQVKYNRLTPGEYTLMVRAANNNGVWSAWQEKMKIEIRPPFWQTLAFRILIIVLLGFSIWGAIRLYIRAKLRKERMLSAQKDARIKEQQRILREVHDDLGSSLTQIQHIRRRVTQEQAENRNSADFEELCDLSTDLFARLGEVIVNIDEGPIQLATLLQKIERHAHRYLSIQNNLDTIIEIPAEIPNLELRNETRQHLELIVKECLHNIVKHAQATQVQLRFQIADKLSIAIQDNGVGIAYLPDQVPLKNTSSYWQKQGNGLRNLRQRASELGGSIFWQNLDPGTLIELEVPLSK